MKNVFKCNYCGISSLHKNIVFRSNKKQTVILPKTTNSLSRRLRPIHANNLEMRYVFYILRGFMLEGGI